MEEEAVRTKLPRIWITEEVEVDLNVPEREQPEYVIDSYTDGSSPQFGLPQVTERGELHHVEHLMEANQRVVTLEDELKAAKEVISATEAKYKEAVDIKKSRDLCAVVSNWLSVTSSLLTFQYAFQLWYRGVLMVLH